MTTPRVTVPVDVEDMRDRAHYLRGYAHTVSAALYGGEKPSGIWNLNRAADLLDLAADALSAAPAPEGGADFYTIKAAIERAMMDERDGKPCGCIIEAGCESRGYADPAYAASGFIWAATDAVMRALTTREEAPAELSGNTGELEAPAEAGEEINWKAEYETLCGQTLKDREAIARIIDPEAFVPMEDVIGIRKAFAKAEAVLALRAQPPARSGEDQ